MNKKQLAQSTANDQSEFAMQRDPQGIMASFLRLTPKQALQLSTQNLDTGLVLEKDKLLLAQDPWFVEMNKMTGDQRITHAIFLVLRFELICKHSQDRFVRDKAVSKLFTELRDLIKNGMNLQVLTTPVFDPSQDTLNGKSKTLLDRIIVTINSLNTEWTDDSYLKKLLRFLTNFRLNTENLPSPADHFLLIPRLIRYFEAIHQPEKVEQVMIEALEITKRARHQETMFLIQVHLLTSDTKNVPLKEAFSDLLNNLENDGYSVGIKGEVKLGQIFAQLKALPATEAIEKFITLVSGDTPELDTYDENIVRHMLERVTAETPENLRQKLASSLMNHTKGNDLYCLKLLAGCNKVQDFPELTNALIKQILGRCFEKAIYRLEPIQESPLELAEFRPSETITYLIHLQKRYPALREPVHQHLSQKRNELKQQIYALLGGNQEFPFQTFQQLTELMVWATEDPKNNAATSAQLRKVYFEEVNPHSVEKNPTTFYTGRLLASLFLTTQGDLKSLFWVFSSFEQLQEHVENRGKFLKDLVTYGVHIIEQQAKLSQVNSAAIFDFVHQAITKDPALFETLIPILQHLTPEQRTQINTSTNNTPSLAYSLDGSLDKFIPMIKQRTLAWVEHADVFEQLYVVPKDPFLQTQHCLTLALAGRVHQAHQHLLNLKTQLEKTDAQQTVELTNESKEADPNSNEQIFKLPDEDLSKRVGETRQQLSELNRWLAIFEPYKSETLKKSQLALMLKPKTDDTVAAVSVAAVAPIAHPTGEVKKPDSPNAPL